MLSNEFKLQVDPGGMPPVIHLAQYDTGRTFRAYLIQGGDAYNTGLGTTAKIKGRNARGVCWELPCTIDSTNMDQVTFTPSGAATDQFGIMPVQMELTNSQGVISTLLMVWDIQKAGYTSEDAATSPEFETALEAAVAAAIAGQGLGFTEEFKQALLDCFNNVAWATADGQTYVEALETALYPEVHLTSITADYEQDRPILDTNSLDLVKLDLVVTANYSDGTTETVTDYELSGTLTAGTSTITVSYGGKTDEISVTVKHNYADSLSNWLLTATSGTAVYENGEISLHCRNSSDISNYNVYTADRAKTLWSAVEGKTLKIRLKVRGDDFGDYSSTNKLIWAVGIYKNASVTGLSGDSRPKWKNFTSFAPTNNAAWVEDTLTATIANMTGGTGTPTSESTFGLNVYIQSLKYAYIMDAEIYEV